MRLLDRIKNVFTKKEEEPIIQEKVFHEKTLEGKRDIDKECEICHQRIGVERYSHQAGYYFHKKCYKSAKRNSLGVRNG